MSRELDAVRTELADGTESLLATADELARELRALGLWVPQAGPSLSGWVKAPIAAELLCVSESTLRTWRREGKGPKPQADSGDDAWYELTAIIHNATVVGKRVTIRPHMLRRKSK